MRGPRTRRAGLVHTFKRNTLSHSPFTRLSPISPPMSTAPTISTATPADYFALLKPRVMRLVVFTALVGMLLAPGAIDPVLGFVAIVCIAVGAGASGALNQWYDADIDAVMDRTVTRPIPAGDMEASEALTFGAFLSAAAVVVLGLLASWVAAGLLAFTIFFYAVVYTMWLKRRTPQNIVIGGAAGAFPPMIGWTAVTGDLSWQSATLFALIFVWTPPHFWALALYREGDYHAASVPMLPNVKGVASTKRQILIYAVVTALVGLAPVVAGFAGWTYGISAAILGAMFVWFAWTLHRAPDADMAPARKLFGFSLVYLTALFAVLLVQALAWRFFEVAI